MFFHEQHAFAALKFLKDCSYFTFIPAWFEGISKELLRRRWIEIRDKPHPSLCKKVDGKRQIHTEIVSLL